MTDRIVSGRVICQGGLNTNQNYLELSEQAPGQATFLQNFESSLTGGYRTINGYSRWDAESAEVTEIANPAEGAVLGVFGFSNSNGSFEVYACRKLVSGNEYGFFLSTGSGWELVTTGSTRNSVGVTRVRSEVFNFGVENVIIFVDGINPALAFDGSDWYELTSAGTGTEMSPGGDQILDAPSVIANFKNHVFLGGDPSYPGIVCNSAPEDFLNFEASAGALQHLTGFATVNLKPFRDELYVFGYSRIRKLIPDAAAGFVFQDVTTNLGCIARDSIFELAGNLVFMSNDGIRIVAGTAKIGDVELSTISQNVQNTLNDIRMNYDLETLVSVVVRAKTQFRYFIGDGTIDVGNAYGIIGSIKVVGDGIAWEFGELKGIRANTAWSGYHNATEYILHGDYDGNVYQQESGNSFNGADIEAVYRTPYLDFGDTEIRKTLRVINTFIKANGSFTMSIGVKYDWDSIYKINPRDWNEESTGNSITYDSGALYDDGHFYGAPTQPILKTNITGSGFSTQFTFVSLGQFAPYTIQGYVVEYTTNGRN